jgi:hypothetical protein
VGARQLTLAGDVAGLRGARLVSGVVLPVVAGMVMSCPAGSVLRTGLGGSCGGGGVWRSGGLRGQAASAGVMVMTEPGLSFCSCRIR